MDEVGEMVWKGEQRASTVGEEEGALIGQEDGKVVMQWCCHRPTVLVTAQRRAG